MSGTSGVEDTLKDFWATRPRRSRRGRKIAGVAAGIGNRYGIDPTVVRVAFVVATFYGGAGVLFYLLGWLFLPEQDDAAAPLEGMVKRRRSSTSGAFTVLLCLALIPATGLLWIDNGFSGFLGVLVVLGTLYLLHRSRGHLNRPSPEVPATETFAAAPPTYAMPAPATATEPVTFAATGVPAAEPRPPAWDPLGAAPFAWDLPEPSPPAPEPPAPRRRSRVGLFTVGAALVVAGTLALAAPYAGGWLTAPHIVGLTLAVIGLGMVGGSFVRGGRGLIGLAVPLSIVGLGLTSISPDGWHGVGDVTARPVGIAEVQSSYQRTAGTVTLDLTALPAVGDDVDTRVEVDTGEAVVILPENADVELTCSAGVGDVQCLGQEATGPDSKVEFTDYGADGEGGLKIELDVEVGAGTVEVRRG
ncbi:MAG TPA: PspC domain-containing protein [Actinophytocola sp.]|uniref:PspC domain-containing protein n=1 Tax=Actinophytocola sp. TaxID=1872138 RepID=UPI002DDD52C9|nr:PspC domain-containing protein [Actinophytocola sp.]HEV2779149.1 PspC domain-containing protein [Actinophytocola sp.]